MIWYLNEGREDDVVISTRIRLSRNLKGFLFPNKMDKTDSAELLKKVKSAYDSDNELKKRFNFLNADEIPDMDKRLLVEKNQITHESVNSPLSCGLMLEKTESTSVMINEEDHIRIQSMFCGLETEEAWEACVSTDRLLAAHLPYLFDKDFGFLTAYPTVTGTGLIVSILLHLPGMVMTGNMENITAACEKLNVSLKSVYEYGKKLPGNMFILSNKITTGESEESIINVIRDVAKQISDQERVLRQILVKQNANKMEDRVFRALGTFLNARIISYEECLVLMNDIRFGVFTGMIGNFGFKTLNELLVIIKPAHVQQFKGRPMMPQEKDITRAEMIRHKMDKFFTKG